MVFDSEGMEVCFRDILLSGVGVYVCKLKGMGEVLLFRFMVLWIYDLCVRIYVVCGWWEIKIVLV